MEEFIEAVRQFPCLWNTELKEYRYTRKKEEAWLQIVAAIKNNEIPDSKVAKAEWKKLRDSHRDSLKRSKTKTGQAAEVINNWKYAELMQFLMPYMKNRNRSGNLTMPETVNLTTANTPSSDLPTEDNENSNQSSQITENQNAPSSDLQMQGNENSNQALQITENQNVVRKRKSDKIDKDLVEMMREIDENYNRRCEERQQRRITESQKAVTDKHPLDSFFESMCSTTKQFPTWLQNSVKRKIFTIVSEAEDTFENCNYSNSSYSYGYNTNTTPHSTASTSTCDNQSMSIIQDNLCIPTQQSPQ